MEVFLKLNFIDENKLNFIHSSPEYNFCCEWFNLHEIENHLDKIIDLSTGDYFILHIELINLEEEKSILIGEKPWNKCKIRELVFSKWKSNHPNIWINQFIIFSDAISKITIHSIKVSHFISFRYSTESEIFIWIFDNEIWKLAISGNSSIRILRSKIDNLYLDSVKSSSIKLESTTIKKLESKSCDLSSLIFSIVNVLEWKILVSNILEIVLSDTDLWWLIFSQVKFNKPVGFIRSNISSCRFIWVTWNRLYLSTDWTNYSDVKNAYQQLKFWMDQTWNKTEANKFFAKEMEYYRKSLLENYSWKTFFDPEIWQKRVICWYNQLTNDFGNSWIRPILWMILLVGIATSYEFLNHVWGFDWNKQIIANILPISEIWKFNTWYSLLYQVCWAALIYQIVVALRRISQR